MKKLIPIFVCVILFSACQQTKQGIVKDLLDAENSFEKEKVNQLLSDSFMFYGPVTLNKDAYLSRVDSLKSIELSLIHISEPTRQDSGLRQYRKDRGTRALYH